MQLKQLTQLEDVLINQFNASISSIDEINNSYPLYSLVGDNEHDYSLLHKVFKIEHTENKTNPYNVIFVLVFSKNGGIFDIKGLGEEPKQMNELWKMIKWED